MSVQTSFPSVSDLLTISTARGIIRRPRQKEETTSRRVRKGRAEHVAAHRRHSGGSVGRVALKILLPALAITTEHLSSRRNKTKHHRVSGQHQVCRCGPRGVGWCGGRRGRGQRIGQAEIYDTCTRERKRIGLYVFQGSNLMQKQQAQELAVIATRCADSFVELTSKFLHGENCNQFCSLPSHASMRGDTVRPSSARSRSAPRCRSPSSTPDNGNLVVEYE